MVKASMEIFDSPLIYKYKGKFNFKQVYDSLMKIVTNDKYELIEKQYKTKGSGDEFEKEIRWDINKKLTSYIMFEINLRLLVYPTSKKPKKDVIDGFFKTEIQANMITDHANKWTGKFERLENFLKDHILEFYIKSQAGKLEEYCFELNSKVKELVSSSTKKTGF